LGVCESQLKKKSEVRANISAQIPNLLGRTRKTSNVGEQKRNIVSSDTRLGEKSCLRPGLFEEVMISSVEHKGDKGKIWWGGDIPVREEPP